MSDTLAAVNARLARVETAIYEEHRRRTLKDAGGMAYMVDVAPRLRCECAFCREYEAERSFTVERSVSGNPAHRQPEKP